MPIYWSKQNFKDAVSSIPSPQDSHPLFVQSNTNFCKGFFFFFCKYNETLSSVDLSIQGLSRWA